MFQLLLERLEATGYTHAAITHTIYGRPSADEDNAKSALPESLWVDSSAEKNSRASETKRSVKPSVRVLRRLHAVIENLSDLGSYASSADEYDLVSISPRNDTVFQAVCASGTGADIITLDYTAGRGRVQLPFKIRTVDVKAAVKRNAVFEIPYAPAVLNRNQRKALVQTCRELQMASLGLKPRIILSSGDRSEGENDASVMALRSPGDLVNLLSTVMRFDSRTASRALTMTPSFAMEQARKRRFGDSAVSEVYTLDDAQEEWTDAKADKKPKPVALTKSKLDDAPERDAIGEKDHEDVVEDGFIAF